MVVGLLFALFERQERSPMFRIPDTPWTLKTANVNRQELPMAPARVANFLESVVRGLAETALCISVERAAGPM
jgi:hypothetical protein